MAQTYHHNKKSTTKTKSKTVVKVVAKKKKTAKTPRPIKYYSATKNGAFSDSTLTGIRKKSVKELRKITKGGTFPFGTYSHHVMIFNSPEFTKEHFLGTVDRNIIAGKDGKTIVKEYFYWYDAKRDKRTPIYQDGTTKR